MLRAALVKARLLRAYPEVHACARDERGPTAPNAKKSRRFRGAVGVASALALGASVACGLTGCFVGDRQDYRNDTSSSSSGSSVQPPSNNPPIAVKIDTSQALTTTPGDGVGIFVEYEGQGVWKLWTTCDTNKSGVSCGFDLYVTADQLQMQSLDNTEETDFVDVSGPAAHASFDTASDTDGVTFTATPGAYLELEVFLDGKSAEEFVYWVSDGKVNAGATSNPIDFWPT